MEDADTKARSQAVDVRLTCLLCWWVAAVHGEVPFDLLAGAAVQSKDRKPRVERMFADAAVGVRVVVRPDWYYP